MVKNWIPILGIWKADYGHLLEKKQDLLFFVYQVSSLGLTTLLVGETIIKLVS